MESLNSISRQKARAASISALVDVAYNPNQACKGLRALADLICLAWDSAGARRAMLGILKGREEGKTLEVSIRDAMIAVDSEQARVGQMIQSLASCRSKGPR